MILFLLSRYYLLFSIFVKDKVTELSIYALYYNLYKRNSVILFRNKNNAEVITESELQKK